MVTPTSVTLDILYPIINPHLHPHSMTFYLDNVFSCTQSLLKLVSGWVPRHVVGAVLVSLPAISVFSHLACSLHLPIQVREKES